MSYISVQEVSKTYQQKGTSFRAMDRVNLEIEKGEFICLLGPSGCGKTTLLNTMAGFEKADSGSILIDGQPVTKPVPNRVTVFQHYGLLPWQTVEKNVMFGLEAQKVPKEEARKRADQFIEMVGLRDFIHHRPSQLSGGMQQRVGIAMAMSYEPKLLLADEPTSALDVTTQAQIVGEMARLRRDYGTAILLVTHNLGVAAYLSDRILVMRHGRIEEAGNRDTILQSSTNAYTRSLLESVPTLGGVRYV